MVILTSHNFSEYSDNVFCSLVVWLSNQNRFITRILKFANSVEEIEGTDFSWGLFHKP